MYDCSSAGGTDRKAQRWLARLQGNKHCDWGLSEPRQTGANTPIQVGYRGETEWKSCEL